MTMGDVLNRHFQNVLHISKSRSGLIQFSIFGAYAVMALPVGMFARRYGYKAGVLLGLALYSCGAFLFVPAANAASFAFFRFALFVLACGLATLETVAHPFITELGNERSSERRLNFAQGFNGLGGVAGSMLGGYFILGGLGQDDMHSVKTMYVIIGCTILAVAVCFFFVRIPAVVDGRLPAKKEVSVSIQPVLPAKGMFRHKHFVWAIVANFCCVAIQGGTWAYFINYGVEKMHLTSEKAAYYFGLSMILKMGGRFLGVWWMRFIAPNVLLAIFSIGGIAMCLLVAQGLGWPSFVALIMLNFFFSILIPTVYGLGLKDMGAYKKQASSFIVLGVSGGAVFPLLMGLIANHDIAAAYYLPIICYAFLFLFAVKLCKLR